MSAGRTEPLIPQRQLGEITNRIIGLFAEHTGHGPMEGKTYLNDNTLVTVLRGALTELEETLLDQGAHELVRAIRVELEVKLREPLMAAVAELAGRPISDYASQLLVEDRVLVEIFTLTS